MVRLRKYAHRIFSRLASVIPAGTNHRSKIRYAFRLSHHSRACAREKEVLRTAMLSLRNYPRIRFQPSIVSKR